MSDFIPRLPARPSFEQLRKQASERLRALRVGDPRAKLAGAQFALAREYGFESWSKLKHYLALPEPSLADQYELLAQDLVEACDGDAAALQRLHHIYGNDFMHASKPFTAELLRSKLAERLQAIAGSPSAASKLAIADARLLIARQHGVSTWAQLVNQGGGASPQPYYRIHSKDNTIAPGPVLSARTWDVIFDVMKERGITGLNAGGRMTDAALKRLSKLDHVTRLDLDGSNQITDEGLRHLGRMPQLRELNLGGSKGQITDQGLKMLKHLPELRRFDLCWQPNVSDVGVAQLAACDRLESVNLLGTPTGDGVMEALADKSHLRRFRSGVEVTDAGLVHLHRFPAFKMWRGGEPSYSLMSPDAGPTHLLIDGPFTDKGLAHLAGLDGLFGLTFFWHCPAFTSAGLARLTGLPRLGFLGCQDHHCDDEAMRHIAAIPGLRMLAGQGAVATDDGFKALSRSQTIEYIWGRECPNLTSAGFKALAKMPALRGLAVSCRNVDDAALSLLPRFPTLRELMPMDVADSGFRHIGKCSSLAHLWCMYCRDTGDAATEHITGLNELKSYYAGASQITDRSLALLGRMDSLERLEFWQCLKITDAGVAQLTGLPNLQEIVLGGLPGVTLEATTSFSVKVNVVYS